MKQDFFSRVVNSAEAATRLITFIVGSALASWLLFGALDAIIQAVAS